MSYPLNRELLPEEGVTFVVMPYGVKQLPDGRMFDFDKIYDEISEMLIAMGLCPIRADSIYGASGVLDTVWQGIQRASTVIIDFSTRNPNVALEAGFALVLGKRIVAITQDPHDIPSDLSGTYRYVQYTSDHWDMKRMKEQLQQEIEAINKTPAREKMLTPLPLPGPYGTDPVPVTVVIVQHNMAIVEAADGRRGILGPADVEMPRIVRDMTTRFKVGDRLDGSFEMDFHNGMKYSLVSGQADPWPGLAASHAPGTTFVSTVHSVPERIGAFVSVDQGVKGLIPHSRIPASQVLTRGTEVEVTVLKLDAEKRLIDLKLERVLGGSHAEEAQKLGDAPKLNVSVGDKIHGEVVRCVAAVDHRGGFILLRLPGVPQLAMLHMSKMSDELREDLADGQVEEGEVIPVEVIRVDAVRSRIELSELPDEDGVVVEGVTALNAAA